MCLCVYGCVWGLESECLSTSTKIRWSCVCVCVCVCMGVCGLRSLEDVDVDELLEPCVCVRGGQISHTAPPAGLRRR